MSKLRFGAIDAGSNAMRIAIAKPSGTSRFERIYYERVSVRLGEKVFRTQEIGRRIRNEALDTFRTFRNLLNHFGVDTYRAVTTSAARQARDKDQLVSAIADRTGINLEIIDAEEEARLVRVGCLAHFGDSIKPRLIVDVGGGSLQISLLANQALERFVPLNIGMLRLRDTFEAAGKLSDKKSAKIYTHVLGELQEHFPNPPSLAQDIAFACAGNAEDLARLTSGRGVTEIPVLKTELLDALSQAITRSDVATRMRLFDVSMSRAEVMGLATLTFRALSDFFKIQTWQVPGLGVKDGILYELVQNQRPKN